MDNEFVWGSSPLNLCHYRTDAFQAGILSVRLVVPISEELSPLHSLVLSVLRRGTRRFPTLTDLNRELDRLWGTTLSLRNRFYGDYHSMGFTADLLDESYLPAGEPSLLSSAANLIHEILYCPCTEADGTLLERYVEDEKKLRCDTIRAQKNDPRGYAQEKFCDYLFEGDPLSIPAIGTEEQIRKVTPEELTAVWKDLLANLRYYFVYVGPASREEVEKTLSDAFPEAVGNGEGDPLPMSVRALPDGRVRRIDEPFPADQSQLCIGYRTGINAKDPLFFAARVMNELLGNSPVSRLFMQVREKKSLCYSCYSSFSLFKGTVSVFCGIKRENRAAAEEEILRQVALIADGDFTDAELEAAKLSLRNDLSGVEDSASALAAFAFSRALLGDSGSIPETRRAIDAVTREEVAAAARRAGLFTVYFCEGTGNGGDGEEEGESGDEE